MVDPVWTGPVGGALEGRESAPRDSLCLVHLFMEGTRPLALMRTLDVFWIRDYQVMRTGRTLVGILIPCSRSRQDQKRPECQP